MTERMSTYPLEKLLAMWKSGEITVEQVAGYMLQNLVLIEKRLIAVEKGGKYIHPPKAEEVPEPASKEVKM